MSNKLKQILKLLPVRTAPFFAAGILLCAGGGIFSVISVISAVVLSVLAYRFRREMLASALALLLGMLSISAYILLICKPLEAYADISQRLTLHITQEHSAARYSSYECRTLIDGRPATLFFYSDEDYSAGDILRADVRLTDTAYEINTAIKAAIDEVHEHISPTFSLRRSVAEFRSELQQKISGYIEGDAGTLAQGLLFGDTSGFSTELYHAAKISGVVHFTAVSGSHFVIIMAVLLELAGNRKRLRAVLSLICVPLAVMFFGAEPSVVRAGIMVFLCNCGPLFSRRAESINSLCVAILVMTAFTPYVMLDIGFQMSVLGVFGVSVVGPRITLVSRRYTRRLPEFLRGTVDTIAISACAVICIAPISAAIFGGVSLTGVFTTVVLTPVFSAALALAVIFAFTGLTPLLLPIGLLMKAAYHIIMLFGCDSRLWLVLDLKAAGFLALVAAVSLTIAAVFYDEKRGYALTVLALSVAASIGLSMISSSSRRKIELFSDGTSGAAVVCIKDEAAVLICGSGNGLDIRLADCLLRNGTRTIRYISAEDLTISGADALITIAELYPTEHINTNALTAHTLAEQLRDIRMTADNIDSFTVDGISIACAKAGDTDVAADIVMYYGYKKSEPAHNARLPLYISSRQEILPENGINIYDTNYEIRLERTEK